MPICPRGHESQAEDWCDFCGFPMTPPPGLAVPGQVTPGPAQPAPGHPAPPPARAQAFPDVTEGLTVCPICRSPQTDRYCEECGYDYDLSSPSRRLPPAPAPASLAPPAPAPAPVNIPAAYGGAPTPPAAPAPQAPQAPQRPPAPEAPSSGYGYPRPSAYEQPAYEQAPYEQAPYERPAYEPPAPYENSGYGQPANEQPRYEQPRYEQPAYERPAPYEASPYEQPAAYQQPAFEQPAAYREPGPYQQPRQEQPQGPYQQQGQEQEQSPYREPNRPHEQHGPQNPYPQGAGGGYRAQGGYQQPGGYEQHGAAETPGGPVYAQPGPAAQGEEFGTSFKLAPPLAPGAGQTPAHGVASQQPAPPVRGTWMAVVSADRAYFDDMMARSGPEAAGLFFPPYCPERRIPLTGRGQLRIGRRSQHRGTVPEIDLSVPPEDPGASHQHALLAEQADGSWVLVDQDSTNGTTVNGGAESVAPHTAIPLNDGDRVHIGAWTTITLHRS